MQSEMPFRQSGFLDNLLFFFFPLCLLLERLLVRLWEEVLLLKVNYDPVC